MLDPSGIAWVTYSINGLVYCQQWPHPTESPPDPVQVSQLRRYRYPRIRAFADGSLGISAWDDDDKRTVHWRSRDRNLTWEWVS